MNSILCYERAHAARGSNFLLRRQKQVTKEKATPTFALIRDLKRKRRAIRNSLRSDNGPPDYSNARRFHSKSRGRIHGDPFEPTIDRCATRTTGTRMRASGFYACMSGSALSSAMRSLALASSWNPTTMGGTKMNQNFWNTSNTKMKNRIATGSSSPV